MKTMDELMNMHEFIDEINE